MAFTPVLLSSSCQYGSNANDNPTAMGRGGGKHFCLLPSSLATVVLITTTTDTSIVIIPSGGSPQAPIPIGPNNGATSIINQASMYVDPTLDIIYVSSVDTVGDDISWATKYSVNVGANTVTKINPSAGPNNTIGSNWIYTAAPEVLMTNNLAVGVTTWVNSAAGVASKTFSQNAYTYDPTATSASSFGTNSTPNKNVVSSDTSITSNDDMVASVLKIGSTAYALFGMPGTGLLKLHRLTVTATTATTSVLNTYTMVSPLGINNHNEDLANFTTDGTDIYIAYASSTTAITIVKWSVGGATGSTLATISSLSKVTSIQIEYFGGNLYVGWSDGVTQANLEAVYAVYSTAGSVVTSRTVVAGGDALGYQGTKMSVVGTNLLYGYQKGTASPSSAYYGILSGGSVLNSVSGTISGVCAITAVSSQISNIIGTIAGVAGTAPINPKINLIGHPSGISTVAASPNFSIKGSSAGLETVSATPVWTEKVISTVASVLTQSANPIFIENVTSAIAGVANISSIPVWTEKVIGTIASIVSVSGIGSTATVGSSAGAAAVSANPNFIIIGSSAGTTVISTSPVLTKEIICSSDGVTAITNTANFITQVSSTVTGITNVIGNYAMVTNQIANISSISSVLTTPILIQNEFGTILCVANITDSTILIQAELGNVSGISSSIGTAITLISSTVSGISSVNSVATRQFQNISGTVSALANVNATGSQYESDFSTLSGVSSVNGIVNYIRLISSSMASVVTVNANTTIIQHPIAANSVGVSGTVGIITIIRNSPTAISSILTMDGISIFIQGENSSISNQVTVISSPIKVIFVSSLINSISNLTNNYISIWNSPSFINGISNVVNNVIYIVSKTAQVNGISVISGSQSWIVQNSGVSNGVSSVSAICNQIKLSEQVTSNAVLTVNGDGIQGKKWGRYATIDSLVSVSAQPSLITQISGKSDSTSLITSKTIYIYGNQTSVIANSGINTTNSLINKINLTSGVINNVSSAVGSTNQGFNISGLVSALSSIPNIVSITAYGSTGKIVAQSNTNSSIVKIYYPNGLVNTTVVAQANSIKIYEHSSLIISFTTVTTNFGKESITTIHLFGSIQRSIVLRGEFIDN